MDCLGILNSRGALGSQSAKDQALSYYVQKIITKKEELVEKNLSDMRARYHPITGSDTILISGDVFNTGFMIFEGIKAIIPATKGIVAIGIATTVCGVIGGVINIAVGMICLKEAIQALKNKDYLKGARLLNDGIFCCAIGMFMILATLSTYMTVLGGIGAFLTANPWVLPLLIFIITLPLLFEILNGTQKIWRQQDIPSTLQFNMLKKILENEEVNWTEILSLWEGTVLDYKKIKEEFNQKGLESLSDRMEVLQANVGPEAAITTYKLFQAVLEQNREIAQKHLKELKGHVTFWNRAQHVRLFQQVLFIGSFVVSMIALRPKVNSRSLIATQNFTMALASGIPGYMDIFWPFARNVPITLPKVHASKKA
ncbi:MAG: hypothetical protein K940chlam6_00620 [Chlamydiae bacterium]|nr:hypothetical protein [Chlamydiota bacterium]